MPADDVISESHDIYFAPGRSAKWDVISESHDIYFAPGRSAKYCDEYVCLSVCPLNAVWLMRTAHRSNCVIVLCYT